jgi:general secretion pathway protein D
MMMRKLAIVLVVVVVASACASSRAFRRGQDAVRVGDWDAAVEYFTKAVQGNPDSAEYKINLQRAQEEAARVHIEKARALEQKDELDNALTEYRRALELNNNNRLIAARVAELERTIRERLEASRPKPKLDQLQQQARAMNAPPLLNPASREPLRINFNGALKDLLNFIGTTTGINITYDKDFADRPYQVTLDGVSIEEALQQVLTANQAYYKIINPKTILVIPDTPQKHQQYDELVMKVFFLSHADATEVAQLVNTMFRIPQMPVQPMVMASKTANTISVRGTAAVVDAIERYIKANDKPRAEVLLDVEILEVNRQRLKRYGINLSAYALNLTFSPELAPPNTSATPGTAPASPPPFNLNTISQGVNTADFYLGVPTAVVNFLESDSHSKTLAKPQLRGAEGDKMTLNLGQEIPVLSTVFGAAAAGGFATIPQSSYNYRTIGVILDITPHVTYEGEIRLDVSVESSALGSSVEVGGQSAPSFTSRKVATHLRLREGEANLLAGLIRQDTVNSHGGTIGLMHLPVIRQLFSNNDISDQDTDIVMLITPHIVRDHELTPADVGSIYIGTQQNVGLGGPPPLIAPQPQTETPQAATPAGTTAPQTPVAGAAGVPNAPQPGVPGPPVAAPMGAQPQNPPLPPGTLPVPGLAPQPSTTTPPAGTQPAPGGTPPAVNPPMTTPPTTPPAGEPTTPPTTAPAAGATPTAPATGAPGTTPPQPGGATPPTRPATPTQIIVTPPGTEFRVAGGPYTVPVSINNASRLSVLTLTITYNPAVLRVRSIQDGTFLRQGGITASYTPKIDAAGGRADIAWARVGDQAGASGSGLLAAVIFDAIAPGSTQISVSGVGSTPDGVPVTLSFAPVTVTVR